LARYAAVPQIMPAVDGRSSGNRLVRPKNRGKPALARRFAEKCVFDYTTGCVLWSGGTAGRGNSARYGVFWDDGRWFAHRWAAVHIHGIELGPNEAGHCCPAGPNTLCVQHLEGQTKTDNVIERNSSGCEQRPAAGAHPANVALPAPWDRWGRARTKLEPGFRRDPVLSAAGMAAAVHQTARGNR
jgi:hypothetical protein